jgi:Flp pilus assembly protein TadG
MTGNRLYTGNRGTQLFEFALVSLQLFVVIFGLLEIGRFVLVYTDVANAARVGARYASVHGCGVCDSTNNASNTPATAAQVCSVVQSYANATINTALLVCGATTGGRIAVSWPDGAEQAGYRVQVTVVYPYNPMFGLIPLNVNLGSTTEEYIMF